MYLFVSIVAFVILIAFLVGIHELGHFATARAFGIRVVEFGIGFPPRLAGRRRGETLYSINAIPLGGFVRMEGENSVVESSRSFGAKPAWQRAIVLCAGVAMNFLGALVLFFLVFTIAPVPQDTARVGLVQPRTPAAQVLKLGDVITAVNGVATDTQTEVAQQIACSAGQTTILTIQRSGRQIERTVVPRINPPPGQGRVGFRGTTTFTGTDAVSALQETINQPGIFVRGIFRLFSQPHCSSADLTGPVGIARVTGSAANAVPQLGLGPVLYLTALISMNLAFVNLLPIPALDGGRLLFVLLGVVRRRTINPQLEGLIHLVGLLLLLGVVALVSAHDISLWLNGK